VTIGLLAVGASAVRGFDADALETLSSLANQATIALENARLEARLRELPSSGSANGSRASSTMGCPRSSGT